MRQWKWYAPGLRNFAKFELGRQLYLRIEAPIPLKRQDTHSMSETSTPDTIEMRACIACGSTAPRQYLYVKEGLPIFRCGTCGLGSTDVTNFDPKTYYDANYFNGNLHDGYADYQASELVLRHDFSEIVSLLKSHGPNGGTLLELGCAYGFFLNLARAHFDVYGIEICSDAVQACNARGLVNVKQGTAESHELQAIPRPDTVVMLDVIEHLQSPEKVLEMVARRLKPGGTVLLTTGDFASWPARLFGKNWRLMTPPQHLWFFTPESLNALGTRCGLEVISIEHPSKRVPLSLILFQLARLLRLRIKPLRFLSSFGIRLNTFDGLRIVFRKSADPA
ncbi:class I SAM-dependent methyltransferase [Pandoraea soli]|uniref:3-demethylubiquinone-9 3-methyltransferase n=1 Tax=Pandoraea soli TaxID=2508293 RepID=A0ABY6W6S2_9BURK|nr:class I SAM-dependent methyltransferase [Pandoraea soli]VVE32895.1 3-demethylubiquinone-9 3-methyltransferase [Pandoraea soli]